MTSQNANSSDDREILERFKAREPGAFASIFRAYYAQLVAIAWTIVGERETAEYVAQDVLLELWRRRDNIVLETSLRAHLVRATRHRALNHIRHERVARLSDPEVMHHIPEPSADRDIRKDEIEVAVAQAVRELPAPCRDIFELSRVHMLTYAEIAKVLDISTKTVAAQMGKALRALWERLAPLLPAGGPE
jgi:RNA polymerase sigma-70 factor (ECF subfamily)